MARHSEPPTVQLVSARFELPDPIEATAIATPWPTGEADPVRRFLIQDTQPWHLVPVRLSGRLVAALWGCAAVDVGMSGWMGAVANGKVACTNTLCSVSTLGGHEVLLGLIALCSALALFLLASVTSGFRMVGAPRLALLGLVYLASIGAALGVLAVLLMIVSIFAVLIALVLAVVGTV